MDVLRKEINGIYERQNLMVEYLDAAIMDDCKRRMEAAVSIENDCRVITDASADFCCISGGRFASLIGLCDADSYSKEMNSSDEDVIYNRIHPEDLVDKRMLEYEFFKYIDALSGERKLRYKATCRIRIKSRDDSYVLVDNSTQVIRLSPNGKIWLIQCRYDLSPCREPAAGIAPRIIDNSTGEIMEVALSDKRRHILTEREKEILSLIKEGKPSKQIADMFGISIHTVNRHRQNILEKLSVGNSFEAVMAATAMKLL